MVRISDRIREYWRESARLEEPAVVMVFSSRLSQEEALGAVAQAASEAIRERESRPEPGAGEEEARTGHWSLAPVPGGVALRIDEEPDDFEGLVRRIAAELDALDVDGAFELYEPEAVIELPTVVDLLECRLRVKGERHHYRGPNWRCRANPDALAAGVDAGIDWCLANGSQLPLSFVAGLITASTLRAGDDVRAYMREALDLTAEVGVVHLTSAAPDRFRTVAVSASKGRISLIEGGEAEGWGWKPSLRSIRAVMEAASSWAAYGFVKRGSYRPAAIQGSSLSQDWVHVPHFLSGSSIGEAFENEYVPDAFGTQLLGQGYAGRLPEGPDWKHVPAGAGAVIVEHVDLDAWFDGQLVRFGGHRSGTTAATTPIPELVARARADFADILFTDDIAWGR